MLKECGITDKFAVSALDFQNGAGKAVKSGADIKQISGLAVYKSTGYKYKGGLTNAKRIQNN